MPALQRRKRIGLCLSQKKKRKLNFQIFEELCRSRGYDVTDIDLARPLCTQGPLDLIIHKLSDLLVEAEQDLISHHLVQRLQVYLSSHPRTVLLDPLHALQTLLDRFQSHHLLRSLETQNEGAAAVFSPPCVEISAMRSDVVTLVRTHLTFPIICKTRVAHGPRSHEMSLIFNEDGLSDVTPPCLLQSFINHSAALYKVFVVGSEHFTVQRPSVRNFPPGQTDQRTIFFNSHDVSKAESSSHLSQTTPCPEVRPPPGEVVNGVVRGLRSALGMSLFGVDLIVETQSGRCAVIDVNAFPGYEGVPEFFPALLSHVDKVLAAGEGPPVNPHREAPRTPERPAEESLDSRGPVTAERWAKESDLPAPYKKNRACNPYFNLRTPSVSCDW